MEKAIIILFMLLLLMIFIYSLAQLNLLYHYLKKRKSPEDSAIMDFSKMRKIPVVSIQLPIYNEKNVVERLLRNISEIEYPREKLEIQVLDDSTDASVELTARIISELQKTGLDIKHLRRTHRKNFKAGALKEGLETAKGEFIAIFDADFLPKKDWLKQTIPYFQDEKIGVVQTRWGHLNRDYSLLTKIQAFALDFHFILEQNGRNLGEHFINFNGTAGIWRKKCILDAGNWEGNTLTEDLDLSYRAQLRHWKFKYLEHIETPAELPITMAAARSQQFRWNKGAAENFKKNYLKLLKSNAASFGTKFHGFFHLLNSSLFLIILFLGILSLPVLFIIDENEFYSLFYVLAFLELSSVFLFICYWFTYIKTNKNSAPHFVVLFFSFFSIAMGFSVHNSIAVLEGYFGKKSEFIRTPKFNIAANEKYKLEKNAILPQFSFRLCLEIFLLFYFAYAVYTAFMLENFSMIFYHLMLFCGFGFVVLNSLNFGFKSKSKIPKAVRATK